jgi:Polyketide cyclase / dehydrase and lipid transport
VRAYDPRVRVDVRIEIEIGAPRNDVASYAADPDNGPEWYENIKRVEWRSPKPLAVGSELAFTAEFLRRRLTYTYRVTELAAGERLVMRTAEGRANRKDLERLKKIVEAR